jgi:hypothetical protein
LSNSRATQVWLAFLEIVRFIGLRVVRHPDTGQTNGWFAVSDLVDTLTESSAYD